MGAAEEEGEILLSDGELPQETAQERNSLAEKAKTVGTSVVDAVKDAAPKSKKALKAAAKAVMKARKRAEKQPPKKALSEVYLGVTASVQLKPQLTVTLQDIQGLVLWVLGDGPSPRWVFVKNKPLVSKVVLVALPGISHSLFAQHEEAMPNLAQNFGQPNIAQAPNPMSRQARSVADLLTVPFSAKRKRYLQELAGGIDEQQPGPKKAKMETQANGKGNEQLPASHYILNPQQLRDREFLPALYTDGLPLAPGFIDTLPAEGSEAEAACERLVGVDCEMCVTCEGYELTRLTLVDGDGKVLVDELVKPHNAITDHNSAFSGITADMLEGVTTRLADAQALVRQHVPAQALLVGHALDNDLAALKLHHRRLLDTSVMFQHPKGPPFRPKLRLLAERFLNRKIQGGAHDSIEDARAALDLAKLKISKGPAFGMAQAQGPLGERLLAVLEPRRASVIDRPDMISRHVTGSANALPCTTDAQCAEKAAREAGRDDVNLVWTQLRGLNAHLEARAARQGQMAFQQHDPQSGVPSSSAPSAPPFPWPGWQVAPPDALDPRPPRPASHKQPAPHANGKPQQQGSHPSAAAGPASQNGAGNGVHHSEQPGSESSEASSSGSEAEAGNESEEEGQCAGVPPAVAAEQALTAELRKLDVHVGRLYEGACKGTMLIVATCQGDTASVRLMHERKLRAHQKLDGLPPWTSDCDAALTMARTRASRALCFCTVKQ